MIDVVWPSLACSDHDGSDLGSEHNILDGKPVAALVYRRTRRTWWRRSWTNGVILKHRNPCGGSSAADGEGVQEAKATVWSWLLTPTQGAVVPIEAGVTCGG